MRLDRNKPILAISAALLALIVPVLLHAAIVSTSAFVAICGDAIVEEGEVCDDGINQGGYSTSTATKSCTPGCHAFGPYCGDGILQAQFGEQCDAGSQNGSGGLCSSTCQSLPAVPPGSSGSPTVGSIPSQNAPSGNIPSSISTQVVLRGKAYPGATVNILLDGQKLTTVQADSNADFQYVTNNVTPGTATFSFLAFDDTGVQSFINSETFQIVQSAITTVSNIFLPPTISASAAQVKPGDLLTLSGQSVPGAQVYTQLSDIATGTLVSSVDSSGNWALQIDTNSLSAGSHAAKSYFQLATSSKSGFGTAVDFFIGQGSAASCSNKSDLNGDGKVNLVDFSILLTEWGATGKADLNCDGTVGLADFSILLFHWTG